MKRLIIKMNNYVVQHALINNCRILVKSWVVARIKIGVTRQESNPQSATIHSATRYAACKKNNNSL